MAPSFFERKQHVIIAFSIVALLVPLAVFANSAVSIIQSSLYSSDPTVQSVQATSISTSSESRTTIQVQTSTGGYSANGSDGVSGADRNSIQVETSGGSSSVSIEGVSVTGEQTLPLQATITTSENAPPVVTTLKGTTAEVKEVGDEITVILRPAGGGTPSTVKINKSATADALVNVGDFDGDGVNDRLVDWTKSGKKPKEMVIKGQLIKENAELAVLFSHSNLFRTPGEVANESDLAFLAARAINDNPTIDSATFSEGFVSIDSSETGKLLWLMPMSFRQTVVAHADGRVSVEFPWWHFLVKKDLKKADLEKELTEKFSAEKERIQKLQEEVTKQAEIFSMISNVLKTRHDTAMNSIRNMK